MKSADSFRHTLFDLDENPGAKMRVASCPLSCLEDHGRILVAVPFFTHGVDEEPRVEVLEMSAWGTATLRLQMGQRMIDSAITEGAPGLDPVGLQVEETDSGWEIQCAEGKRYASISKGRASIERWSDLISPPPPELEMTFYPDGQTALPLSAHDHFYPGHRESVGLGFIELDGVMLSMSFACHAQAGERFAGTGERFAGADLAGRTLLLENTDALGVNSRRAYKNVPLLLSSRGYGIFLHTGRSVRWSVADLSTRATQAAVPGASLDVFVIGGGGPREVLAEYRLLTGVPPELPPWSYGIWMSRMTYFSAQEVEEIADRLRREDYPCDVIHLDTGWFEKDWVCEWKFGSQFPDPAAFMRRMAERGFKITLWQNPNIMNTCCWAEELLENRYVVPKAKSEGDGSDFSGNHCIGQIDFSNPGAVGWYQERLDELFDLGADAIKTDFGEVIAEDVSYYGGSAPELRNLYSLLYQKAAFESTQRRKGKDALIWARAGWAGCQRYPIHWGGDCAATWDGMTASLRGGLHLGLSGFGYWSHDVPGFHGLPDFMNSRPDDELVVRWTQFASFTSHFRFHGTTPREPWEFPAVSGLLRDWFKLRYALIPYLCQEGKKVAENGPPILAALSFYHPKDKICWMIDDQYYFGDDILVAPQLQPGGVRDVYLPEGKWVDLWSGIRTTGPIWLHEYESPLERCPIFVREGSSIPVYPKPVSSTLDIQWDQVVSMPFDRTYEGFATSAIRDCGSFGLNHQVQPL